MSKHVRQELVIADPEETLEDIGYNDGTTLHDVTGFRVVKNPYGELINNREYFKIDIALGEHRGFTLTLFPSKEAQL